MLISLTVVIIAQCFIYIKTPHSIPQIYEIHLCRVYLNEAGPGKSII